MLSNKGAISSKLIAILSVSGAAVLTILMIVGYCVSVSNKEVGYRNQATAQQKTNMIVYDAVWKILSQMAQVADASKESFKDIYVTIMEKRYEGDAKQSPLFRWITEQNPNFSFELYAKLDDAIQGQRTKFAMVQAKLVDIEREHTNLRTKWPSSMIVGGRPPLDIKIVLSGKTERAFDTGREDDVDLNLGKK